MKELSFSLLSMREEKKLSTEELKNYYAQLREYVLHRQLKTTTKGAITVAPKLKGFVNKVAGKLSEIMAGGSLELVVDGLENIPAGPVIFASTHQGILDNFCWIASNPKHAVILHSSSVSKLLLMSQLWTGLVLVSKDEANTQNRTDAKLDMIHILLKGESVWYFPEGTWLLSPNKLHLPMSFGFLDVAKKAGAPVIPVVLEFTYDSSTEKEKINKVHIRYGKPIYVSLEDNLNEKLAEYEASISTIRWDLIAEKGVFNRSSISNQEYINYLKGCYKNLAFGKVSADSERAGIRGFHDDFYLFHHINDIPFNENGEFLETEETRRLDDLFRKHMR